MPQCQSLAGSLEQLTTQQKRFKKKRVGDEMWWKARSLRLNPDSGAENTGMAGARLFSCCASPSHSKSLSRGEVIVEYES